MPNIREKYPARVTKTDDPTKRGRIRVTCAGLMGDFETELPDWIEPALDWGWFYVPDIGEQIEIECNAQNSHQEDAAFQAFLENPDIRWCGTRFQSPQGGDPRPPNESFTVSNYGKRRGFATPTGHVLVFDDTEGQEEVTLSWKQIQDDGNAKFSFIAFDQEGSVTISNKDGSILNLRSELPGQTDGQTLLADKYGNTYSSNINGIKLIDKFGKFIEMKDGVTQIVGAGDVIVNAGANATIVCDKAKVTAATQVDIETLTANINASVMTNIGPGADSPFVRYTEWLAWASAHLHPTGVGPSGPPITPPPPTIASLLSKVK